MALKSAISNSDKDMWFQFSDGHFEKCGTDKAEQAWPGQQCVNVGCGTESLKLRAEQLINEAGQFGRFDTLAYYNVGCLEFLRFEKSKERGIDFIFKNTETGEEVNSYGVNMEEVKALHEVISDCWDALQYEKVCRGMNYSGGLYRDMVVDQEQFDSDTKRGYEQLRRLNVFETCSEHLRHFGGFVYATAEAFRVVPDPLVVKDFLKSIYLSMGDLSVAHKELCDMGLKDSWFAGFEKSLRLAIQREGKSNQKSPTQHF